MPHFPAPLLGAWDQGWETERVPVWWGLAGALHPGGVEVRCLQRGCCTRAVLARFGLGDAVCCSRGAGVGLSCACLQAGRGLRGFASCQLSGEAQGWWLLGECLWFVSPAHRVPRGTAKGQLQVAVMLSSLECLMQ